MLAKLFVPADCPLLHHGSHLDPIVHAALAHRLPQIEDLRRVVRDAVGAVGSHAAVGRVAEPLGCIRDVAFSTVLLIWVGLTGRSSSQQKNKF